NPCSSNPCPDNKLCYPDFVLKTFICRDCCQPLGMQDGRITNAQITASSYYNWSQCRYHFARLNRQSTTRTSYDSSWCAKVNKRGEYVEVNLGSKMTVTKVATQGRDIAYSVKQWVTMYTLSYSSNRQTWTEYVGEGSQVKRFTGNTDTTSVVTNELPVPIKAQYIRIVAYSWHQHISMTLELYGCEGGCKDLIYLDCIKDNYFPGHVIKNFTITSSIAGLKMCQIKCYLEDHCVSYNLGPVQGQSRTCELNTADNLTYPAKVVPKEGYEYCPIKNPCSSNPCPANKLCYPDFVLKTFICRDCSQPLGMQDGRITNAQITGSSFKNKNCHYHFARLNRQKTTPTPYDSSWCAKNQKRGEYVEVDLGSKMTVTKVATQGRDIAYSVKQWVTMYTLSYSSNRDTWTEYVGEGSQVKRFTGNTDTTSVVINELPVPIKAQYIRVVVYSWYWRISMRLELYGC
ncbi:hypothetical protein QZH41_010858, partial [Actinostola sp. cb2023]